MDKRERFSPFIFILIVLFLSALDGYLTGRLVSSHANLEGRLNIWWKSAIVNFGIIYVAVEVYFFPLDKLPIHKLSFPPTFISYLIAIEIPKKIFITVFLHMPFLILSALNSSIPYINTLSFLPGFLLVASSFGIMAATIRISPTFDSIRNKKTLAYLAIIFISCLPFTFIMNYLYPSIGENNVLEDLYYLIFIGFTSLLLTSTDSYRYIKKDWDQLRKEDE